MMQSAEHKTLKSAAAVELWLQGREAWNAWVACHLGWCVDFRGVDFSQYRDQILDGIISFAGFKFPNNGITFDRAEFGDGDVSFKGAQLGRFKDDQWNDEDAQFRDANVYFSHKSFWKANFNFEDVKCTKGDFILAGDAAVELWLQGKEVWNAWVACHLDWRIDFARVDFSQYRDQMLDNIISFAGFKFPNCNTSFKGAAFGDGQVSFEGAESSLGNVYFDHISFWTSNFNFNGVRFKDGAFVLSGDALVDLWKKGKEAWNRWVESHGEWRVDFGGVDFNQYRDQIPDGIISFAGLKFPSGGVYFFGATFGAGGVSFDYANFGDVDSWTAPQFEDGDISFKGATFGDSSIFFIHKSFWKANFNFNDVKFTKGSFNLCVDAAVELWLQGREVWNAWVACHLDWRIDFSGVDFSQYRDQMLDNIISFARFKFPDGGVYFLGTTFGDGDVSFDHANFGDGGVFFDSVQFGDGCVSFEDAICYGPFNFYPPMVSLDSTALNFYPCKFKGFLTLKDAYTRVSDLLHTTASNHVDIEGVQLDKEYQEVSEKWLKKEVNKLLQEQLTEDKLKKWESDLSKKIIDDKF